jgi:hypothetical protein
MPLFWKVRERVTRHRYGLQSVMITSLSLARYPNLALKLHD